MEVDDTVSNQLIDGLFVGILVEAHHIKCDLFAKLRLDGFRGGEKLVHALFLHDPAHKQEAAHAVILHGDIGILVQIDASAGENLHLLGGDDVFMQEELSVLLVLKEHRSGLPQGAAIHHGHHARQHRFFKRRAEALHIGDIGNALGFAGAAHVDVGLDGIGDDQIRLDLVQHLAVGFQQLHVFEGIDAAAVDLCIDAAKSHSLQIVLVANERRAENDLMLLHQRLHQLLAEAVEHIGMIGCDQNSHFLLSTLCSSPVPPSTTPSPRRAEMAVPKKQRQSKAKLIRRTYSPSSRALSAISNSSRPQICAQPERPGFTSLAPYLSRSASKSS